MRFLSLNEEGEPGPPRKVVLPEASGPSVADDIPEEPAPTAVAADE